jgi:cell division protein FtsB
MNTRRRTIAFGLSLVSLFCLSTLAGAQAETGAATSQQVAEVLQQIKVLNESLQQTRAELEQSRAEIRELKSTVANLTAALPATSAAIQGAQPERQSEAASDHAATQEDVQVLAARVEEQHQTKVESASRFRLKLSGMVLLNAFSNAGQVDNVDLPGVALPPRWGTYEGGSVGGSMRQSIIGLTGFGPTVVGAHTSGDVQMDFFGGIPDGYAGVASGVARLRIARLRFDWKTTSVVGGLDTPFFSPNSPTSYATVGEPSLSSAGNLWSWVPSIRVEHRWDLESSMWKIEGGVIDPAGYGGYSPSVRYATAGESSRQPSYSVRFSGNHGNSDQRLSVGVAGIYSPSRFLDGSKVNGAGVMVDWLVPFGTHVETSGEFFTGKGLQGFGGIPYGLVQAQDSFHYASSTAPLLGRIGEIGGWSQLKLKVDPRNEFNVAAGYGGYDSSDIRHAIYSDYYIATLPSRNQSLLVNYIVRPRSNLLLSAEYRHLRTTYVTGSPASADLVGLAAGFLF